MIYNINICWLDTQVTNEELENYLVHFPQYRGMYTILTFKNNIYEREKKSQYIRDNNTRIWEIYRKHKTSERSL